MPTLLFRRSSVLLFSAIASLSIACAASTSHGDVVESVGATESPVNVVGVGQPGSHVGVHGMVLFGSSTGKLYLSHIPLYTAPHNLQVIVEVAITGGVPEAAQAFGTKSYSVRPSAFSLHDLAAGTLRNITGTVYFGNFESGGRPIHNGVKFEIKRVVYQRALLPATPASATLDYIAVGTPTEPFLVHVIDAPPSFDQVVAVKLGAGSALDAAALEKGTLVKVPGAENSVEARLSPSDLVSAIDVAIPVVDAAAPPAQNQGPASPDAGAPAAALQVVHELSCLPGTDFYGSCPAAE